VWVFELGTKIARLEQNSGEHVEGGREGDVTIRV